MKDQNKKQLPQYNIHAAADEECCFRMAKNNQWNLLEVRPNENPILEVDCIFEGEQTSFDSEETKS